MIIRIKISICKRYNILWERVGPFICQIGKFWFSFAIISRNYSANYDPSFFIYLHGGYYFRMWKPNLFFEWSNYLSFTNHVDSIPETFSFVNYFILEKYHSIGWTMDNFFQANSIINTIHGYVLSEGEVACFDCAEFAVGAEVPAPDLAAFFMLSK